MAAVDARLISAFDRGVYQALAAYCFGEPVCWPSQEVLGRDLGCSRYAVNRSIGRLIQAGWLRITEKRPGRRGWRHNVYTLLAAWRPVDRGTAKRIVECARRRRLRGLHTNPEGFGRSGDLNGTQRGPRSAQEASKNPGEDGGDVQGTARHRWERVTVLAELVGLPRRPLERAWREAHR
jgi:helix-turn-helix protein